MGTETAEKTASGPDPPDDSGCGGVVEEGESAPADDRGDEADSRLPATESAGWAARLGLAVLRFYQNAISPALPPSCRFRPSCSEYTRIAIQRYGLIRGSWLGLKRILKCHPFHPGGHDPVP